MSVESARPGRGGQRDTNDAEKGSSDTTASGSGRTPFTRSSKRDRIRVSRTKRPSADGVTTSPSLSEMANVDSSTSVTVPPEEPRRGALPAKVHGWLIVGETTGPPAATEVPGHGPWGSELSPAVPGTRHCHYGRSGNSVP